MAARGDDLRKHVNEIWSQAISQLEEVKETVIRNRGRLEGDVLKLRSERDKLLKRLGEQTYRLANQGKLPVPAMVKRTVDRLNEVIDGMVAEGVSAPAPAAAPATKKTTTKKKPATKKTAAKKKTAKKKTSTRGKKKTQATS